jgi:hypothetical protein
MLCNKTKNIIASLMIVICFIIFSTPNLYSNVNASTVAITPKFIATRLIKNKNTIFVDGIFLNGSKDRVYNFKDVKLNVTIKSDVATKSDVLIKSFTFNDSNLKEINLPAGNSVRWRFNLGKQNFNAINLNSIKITCDFNYLTEFNNSFDNRIHVFYDNTEFESKSKQPYIDKNTNTIFIPTEMIMGMSKYLNTKGLRVFLKNNGKENIPQKKKSKNLINDYIPISFLENMLFPKHHVYHEQNDDYCIIIIY